MNSKNIDPIRDEVQLRAIELIEEKIEEAAPALMKLDIKGLAAGLRTDDEFRN